MTDLTPGSHDRLLVVAPHPDDETLACGGLIHRTRAAGGQVCVLLATDGDANPWPQRVAERRWRLGVGAGQRWGARRRAEALAAIRVLGLDVAALVPLGWPDQGITRRMLVEAAGLQARLAAELTAFSPTHVVYPHVADSHPDHSALAFATEAAITQAVAAGLAMPERLAYIVHGAHDPASAPLALALDADAFACKRDAALMHTSQTLFGRERLLRLVHDREAYFPPPTWPTPHRNDWHWQWRGHWALAARVTPDCALAWLDADNRLQARLLTAAQVHALGGRWRRGLRAARLQLPALAADARGAWAKPIGAHRWVTYDGFRWQASG